MVMNQLPLINKSTTKIWVENLTKQGGRKNWNDETFPAINLSSPNQYIIEYEIRNPDTYMFNVLPRITQKNAIGDWNELPIDFNDSLTYGKIEIDMTLGDVNVSDNWTVKVIPKPEPEPEPDPEPEPEPEPEIHRVYKDGDSALYYLEIISSDNVHTIISDSVDVPEGDYKYRINSLSGYEIVSLQLELSNPPYQNEIIDIEINSGTVNVNGNFNLTKDVTFVCTVKEVSEDDGVIPLFNELYKVDSTILYKLNKELIASEFVGVETPSLSPYIINLLELPFRVNVSEISDSIKVGNVNFTDIIASKITRDLIEIDLGEISIPELNQNSYDYLNTDVYIHLPYSDKINIPLEYAISETISIKYLIDLYNGECNITLRSTKINNVFHNATIKIGRNIPFFHKQTDQILNQQNIQLPINNDLTKAYVEILRNKPVENMFDSLVKDSSVMSDFTGYLVVDDIELLTSANQDDREQIKSILRNGVYIK